MSQEMRPPVNRAMRVLDKPFFRKTVPISAARIFNSQHIWPSRIELVKSGDICNVDRLDPIIIDPDAGLAKLGRKCILLRTGLKHDDKSTWGEAVTKIVEADKAAIIPHSLELDYDYWSYRDIMGAILPEDTLDDIPVGFQIVGHVAHLNLREAYLPYKSLIATVLLDKNVAIRTVINKLDTVGEESAFRTFQYEVLAGPDEMDVTVREQDCVFKFNYAKVYWNSRLHTEHERLVTSFKEGEAICDVMAGIGPFALPAGKKKCFVYANDLNPESYAALVDGIKINHAADFVRPFNEDGHDFITSATRQLYNTDRTVTLQPRQSRTAKQLKPKPAVVMTQPKLFSHFVMNLPASALEFLPNFVGLYNKCGIPKSDGLVLPLPLPKIHVYCFSTKSDDNKAESAEICEVISRHLDFPFRPGSADIDGEVEIFDVRDVAPKKRMFCASFRLPASVAYRT